MRRVTILACALTLMCAFGAQAQTTEYVLDVPTSTEFTDAYTANIQSGSRAVSGPFDMDGDGLVEMLVADYTGGGRVHVVENVSADTWELVYTTPWLDSTATTSFNARYVYGTNADADLDGDGMGEILLPTGRSFSANSSYAQGIFVFEYTGTDNDYGDAPASVLEVQDRIYIQASINVEDIDGDGIQEVIFPNNASANDLDKWYVYSVSGDIGSGFEAWTEELGQPSRPDHGGGSPWAIFPSDLDGDGSRELLLHSWNNYNFTIGRATGADTYDVPGGQNLQAETVDAVAYAGGTVIDINQDGDDEVFLNNYSGVPGDNEYQLTVINYETGEDATTVTADNVILGLLPDTFTWGVTSGDLDNDGNMEVMGVGFGHGASTHNAGEPSQFLKVAEFVGAPGADPEDPSNYEVWSVDTSSPVDTAGYNIVHRDSAGVMTKYFSGSGPFAFRAAYIGDPDGDNDNAVALSFQSVRDSIDIIDEVWNPDSLTGVFNTPVDSAGPGPVTPGAAYEFTFNAAEGSFLTFATMFVQSNDLFFAPADSGLALYDGDGNARSGDVTAEVLLWDAGTELNEEPGTGPNQAPRQAGPNTGDADTVATVRLVDDGFTYPATTDVLSVTLTPGEGTSFTVRIENVATETVNGAPFVIAPGVYVTHANKANPVFTDGNAGADGLETLAEDGGPGTLLTTLQNQLGYFRTVRETRAADARPFMRIVSGDGLNAVSVTDERIVLPSDYKLGANYPNPFNPTTAFSFTLPLDKAVSVRVYDISGRLVRTLVDNQIYTKGTHEVTWNGADQSGSQVASGTYLYTLEYGNFRQTRKMVMLK